MASNKSSSQRTGPPWTSCSTGTSLASENQGEQSPSPSVTRALTVGACTAPVQWSCACVSVRGMESCCKVLNMPPPCAAGWVPDRLLTHTVFHLSGSGAFTTSFPKAITVAFGVDL